MNLNIFCTGFIGMYYYYCNRNNITENIIIPTPLPTVYPTCEHMFDNNRSASNNLAYFYNKNNNI
mgnify:FL=1